MKQLLLILFVVFSATTLKAESLVIAIKLDMQMGVGMFLDDNAKKLRSNNAERVSQYMAGKKFDTMKECEMYLFSDKRDSGSVMENYGGSLGLVWNNYASDNRTIVQQWRCLELVVID